MKIQKSFHGNSTKKWPSLSKGIQKNKRFSIKTLFQAHLTNNRDLNKVLIEFPITTKLSYEIVAFYKSL